MATTEAETSRDEHVPPGGLVYDGFIEPEWANVILLGGNVASGARERHGRSRCVSRDSSRTRS